MFTRKLRKCKLNVHEIAKRICTLHIIHFSHREQVNLLHLNKAQCNPGLRHCEREKKSVYNAGEKWNLMWENVQRPSADNCIKSIVVCCLSEEEVGVIYRCIIRHDTERRVVCDLNQQKVTKIPSLWCPTALWIKHKTRGNRLTFSSRVDSKHIGRSHQQILMYSN